jgi:phage/plasmid primase-like uncharacterized protein
MSGFQLDPTDVADLARRLYGEPNRRLSTAQELRFGRRGSLAVVPSRGVFRDYEAGTSGGVMAMLVNAGAAQTIADAARLLESQGIIATREACAGQGDRERQERIDRQRRRAVAASLWAAMGPLAGSVAETYLRDARGVIAALDGAMLGFLPDAPVHPYRGAGGEGCPALVAAVIDAGGDLIGAHLTYLAADGLGKANIVSPARKMVGTVGGGFVRLAASSRLVVAEGLESALSAWDALGGAPSGLGCIAALSAGGVAGLRWPAGVDELIIAPDRDPNGAGDRAAQALARRAWAAGLAVNFLPPPEGFGDWNEAAQGERGLA